MKALIYHGAEDVRVDNVPEPRLQEEDDILLRVTATAICGSDLHLFRGKVPGMKQGDILGHEFMGVVEETGRGVTRVARGDRVVVPFTIACGDCFFCSRSQYAACETTNPARGALLNRKGVRPGAGMFGYSHLYGGYDGGQAEYVRVPRANVGPLRLPDGVADEKVLFLSDILPTGYQAVLNGNVGPGSTVAIFGAGPVGLMAAASARLLGAERIFMVDHHDYRLAFAASTYGVEPINFERIDDAAERIIELTQFRGVDCSIDAVGFEAKGSVIETALTELRLEGSSGQCLRQAIAATRRGGVVSVPGVYAGFIHAFMFGDAFDKGLTFRMGQTHVQQHMPFLLERILDGSLDPALIISHHLPLERAADAYRIFNEKQESCRKVVLTPTGGALPREPLLEDSLAP
ncbi:MAG: zinc-dependent alcohol dehydrogenase [Candidatus Dactylopiibacterium sp.]|nr:zinc-dependent alcohol dehydrogenase [Candidatus Dactylopiibacterium sp.]